MRKFNVKVNGIDYEVEVEEIKSQGAGAVAAGQPSVEIRNDAPSGARSAEAKKGFVIAPLPGIVVELKVAPGQHVTQGETVLLLEAMKMQNEIVASSTGVVQEIYVNIGETVTYEQAMMHIA